jgi:ATP-binding cassette, subfamily G (WHITE), eye pigment precursor transporter
MVLFTQFREKSFITRIFLSKVTGAVHPGEFLAILGASGAGKTTLLNCLTFRTGKLKVSGQRNINGCAIDTDSLARMSAYIQQDDLFIETLTVQEQLRFQVNEYLPFLRNNVVVTSYD